MNARLAPPNYKSAFCFTSSFVLFCFFPRPFLARLPSLLPLLRLPVQQYHEGVYVHDLSTCQYLINPRVRYFSIWKWYRNQRPRVCHDIRPSRGKEGTF